MAPNFSKIVLKFWELVSKRKYALTSRKYSLTPWKYARTTRKYALTSRKYSLSSRKDFEIIQTPPPPPQKGPEKWCRAKTVEKCRKTFRRFFDVVCPARKLSRSVEELFDTFLTIFLTFFWRGPFPPAPFAIRWIILFWDFWTIFWFLAHTPHRGSTMILSTCWCDDPWEEPCWSLALELHLFFHHCGAVTALAGNKDTVAEQTSLSNFRLYWLNANPSLSSSQLSAPQHSECWNFLGGVVLHNFEITSFKNTASFSILPVCSCPMVVFEILSPSIDSCGVSSTNSVCLIWPCHSEVAKKTNK